VEVVAAAAVKLLHLRLSCPAARVAVAHHGLMSGMTPLISVALNPILSRLAARQARLAPGVVAGTVAGAARLRSAVIYLRLCRPHMVVEVVVVAQRA
jgi:hypothetical protein